LGYIFLAILTLGAFLLGLVYILNGSTVLYRQVVDELIGNKQQIIESIKILPSVESKDILKYLHDNEVSAQVRMLVVSNRGEFLLDNQSETMVHLQPLRTAAIRRIALQNSSGLARDQDGKVWIYVAGRIPNSQDFLILASPRQNLTIKFMVSDPMIRLIVRVMIWAMLVSLFLTFFMDRWIARPIREMAKKASSLATDINAKLPVSGVQEVRDLAVALNEMSRQVRESQQSQRDFISDVSHELKTPLTSIGGYSAAILDGTASSDEEIRQSATVVNGEAQRMLKLVNELLALARLEGNVDKLELQNVNLDIVISGAMEKLKPSADERKIRILNLASETPPVLANGDKIMQILLNLVDNAIKYSPDDGEVTISTAHTNTEVMINVTDRGQGIAEDEMEKIFNRFYQIDRSRKGGSGKSSGLGLTIAREIARQHKGDITVTSKPGEGTTFTLHLPRIQR
jgi:signal transduction histidine kinase